MTERRALITGASTGLGAEFARQLASKGKALILVARRAGLVSLAGDTSYGPTKAYLIALSKGLAATVSRRGVHVLALCPGFTHTEFHQSPELARMKNKSPALLWYDAEVVVREGLTALEKGKVVYISGRLYRYLVPLMRTGLGGWLIARMGIERDY